MNINHPHEIEALEDLKPLESRLAGRETALKGSQRYIRLTEEEADRLKRATPEERGEWLRQQIELGLKEKTALKGA